MNSWNAIGKHWLQKYDNTFGVDIFLCKCSDIKGLDIAPIPIYYQDAIHAWNNFWGHVLRNLKMTFQIKTYLYIYQSTKETIQWFDVQRKNQALQRTVTLFISLLLTVDQMEIVLVLERPSQSSFLTSKRSVEWDCLYVAFCLRESTLLQYFQT